MGWFDDQIKEKKRQKQAQLDYAYWSLASVISRKSDKTFTEEYQAAEKNALMKICDYYHIERSTLENKKDSLRKQLEYLQSTQGLQNRQILLEGTWWKEMTVPILTQIEGGQIAAVLPEKNGHFYFETQNGKKVKVDRENAKKLGKKAICFYPPLPLRELSVKDIFVFLWKSVGVREKRRLMGISILMTVIGMFTPFMSKLLFSQIIPTGQFLMVYSVASFLMGTAVASFLLSIMKTLLLSNMRYQMELSLSAAIFSRVLNFRADFFKAFSAGELTERMLCLYQVCGILCESLLGTGMTAIFSLVYLLQIFSIEKRLLFPSVLILAVQLLAAVLGMLGQIIYLRKKLYAGTKVQGLVVSLFTGMQKIKVSGAEDRVFAKWAEKYRLEADAAFNPPLFMKIRNAVAPALSIFGTFIIYWISLEANVQVADYVAYQSAYGMVSGALLAVTGMMNTISAIRPIFELAAPIFEAKPQMGKGGTEHKLSGNVELNNVSFSYTKDGPKIFENLNLKIKRGEYVAIVGKTGCGKSTLMRLLLGFETPDTGVIYYDGVDVEKLDSKSLHRQIGVVMQNGKLFNGSIYSNISISAPQLTMEQAWEAARTAGVAEDIKKMPMGMHTVLSEGGGGISGGQKQRIMIARAIAAKPMILLLDEATSALDNITQKQVSDSLNRMNCTRIVIAHRLSTIQECDRILVLDKGRIIEDGTYKELIQKGGFFAELVERQQLQPGF